MCRFVFHRRLRGNLAGHRQMRDYLSQRAYVVLALDAEKSKPEPNTAVVQACKSALRALSEDPNARRALYIEMSQPREVEC